MKRRNFIKKLFQVTAIGVLAATPLMVIPSIKENFIKIEWRVIKAPQWHVMEKGWKEWKVGYSTVSMTITGKGEKYEEMVKVFDKFQGK